MKNAMIAVALALSACANQPNTAPYAADQAVKAADTSAMSLLAAHKITSAQAQQVATLSQAVLDAQKTLAANSQGSVEAAALAAAIVALQTYLTSIGG